jgi:hypothetical protein
VHDVTKIAFVPGVTNFTAENLFDAMISAGSPITGISLHMHPNMFYFLRKSNLMDYRRDPVTGFDVWDFQGYGIDPTYIAGKQGSIYDTVILVNGAAVCVFRTREA